MPIEQQLRIVKSTIINCLPLRAYIYGQDLVRDLIRYHNKCMAKRKLKKEKSNINFTKAAGFEKQPSFSLNLKNTEYSFMAGPSTTAEKLGVVNKGEDLR